MAKRVKNLIIAAGAFLLVIISAIGLLLGGGLFEGFTAASNTEKDYNSSVKKADVVPLKSGNQAALWNQTIKRSVQYNRTYRVVLDADWVAGITGNPYSFGADGDGIKNGQLVIPAGARIILDLNGHKIDKKLFGEIEAIDKSMHATELLDPDAETKYWEHCYSPYTNGQLGYYDKYYPQETSPGAYYQVQHTFSNYTDAEEVTKSYGYNVTVFDPTQDARFQKYTKFGAVIIVEDGGYLEVQDNSEAKTGKITGGYNLTCGDGHFWFTPETDERAVESYKKVFKEYIDKHQVDITNGTVLYNNKSGVAAANQWLTDTLDKVRHWSNMENFYSGSGGGVYVNGGTLKLISGKITQNSAVEGGGVAVDNGGTLEMYGGEISDNVITMWANGGLYGAAGVVLDDGAHFDMYGGEIARNENRNPSILGKDSKGNYVEYTAESMAITMDDEDPDASPILNWQNQLTRLGNAYSNDGNFGAGVTVHSRPTVPYDIIGRALVNDGCTLEWGVWGNSGSVSYRDLAEEELKGLDSLNTIEERHIEITYIPKTDGQNRASVRGDEKYRQTVFNLYGGSIVDNRGGSNVFVSPGRRFQGYMIGNAQLADTYIESGKYNSTKYEAYVGGRICYEFNPYMYVKEDGSIEHHMQNMDCLIVADDWNGTDPILEHLDPLSQGKESLYGYSVSIFKRVYNADNTKFAWGSVSDENNAYKLETAVRYAVFNMYGGTIDGGISAFASVMLLNGGYFNFVGGEVKNHKSSSGGGIYIGQSGSNVVNFNGGTLRGNYGHVYGGGIAGGNNDDYVYFRGGLITENISRSYGAGIAFQNGSYYFQGPLQVYGNKNKVAVGAADSNVYIPRGKQLFIRGSLMNDGLAARLSVNISGNGQDLFTTGYSEHNSVDPSVFFMSDFGYKVTADSGEVRMTNQPQELNEVTWRYLREGAGNFEDFEAVDSPIKYDGARASFTYGEYKIQQIQASYRIFNETSGNYENKVAKWVAGATTSAFELSFLSIKAGSHNATMNAIMQTGSISDAGEYAFQLKEPYLNNPTLTIGISQAVIKPEEFHWNIAQGGTFTYDGTDKVPTAVTDSGISVNFNITGPTTGGKARNVGEYVALIDSLSDQNYRFDSTGGTPRRDFSILAREVSIIWEESSFTYDGLQHVPTARLDGVAPIDVGKVTINIGAMDGSTCVDAGYNVAEVKNFNDTTGHNNYTFNEAESFYRFYIAKRDVTVVVNNGSLAYGHSTLDEYAEKEDTWGYPAGTATANMFVASDTKWDVVFDSPAFADANTKVGHYELTASFKGATAYDGSPLNYNVTFVNSDGAQSPAELTVTPANFEIASPIVANSFTYDGKFHEAFLASELEKVSANGVVISWTFMVDGVDSSYSATMPKFRDAGAYTIRAIAAADNYNSEPFRVTLTVSPKPITESDIAWADNGQLLPYNGAEQFITATFKEGVIAAKEDINGNPILSDGQPVLDDVQLHYGRELSAKDVKLTSTSNITNPDYRAYRATADYIFGTDSGNYSFPTDPIPHSWGIAPLDIQVNVIVRNITATLAPHLTIDNWLMLTTGTTTVPVTKSFVGDDKTKSVEDVLGEGFDLTKFEPYLRFASEAPIYLDSSGENAGSFDLSSVQLGENESKIYELLILSGWTIEDVTAHKTNLNYNVSEIVVTPGKLTVMPKTDKFLTFVTGSTYKFLKLVTDSRGRRSRKVYEELTVGGVPLQHGVNDIEGEYAAPVIDGKTTFYIGQISPRTTVATFISAITSDLLNNIVIYNQRGGIVYNGRTPSETPNPRGNVGTGWSIEFGADYVYKISVLGDLSGDGMVNGTDTSNIKKIVNGTANDSANEVLLAAYLANRGSLNGTDVAYLKRIVSGTETTSKYFYKG